MSVLVRYGIPQGGRQPGVRPSHAILVVADPVNYTQTFTDSTGVTDQTTQLSAVSQAFTDPVGSTDSTAQTAASPRSFTDDAGSTDAAAQVAAVVRLFTDDSGLVDSVSQSFSGGSVNRLWPATNGPGSNAGDTSTYTMGMRFVLSSAATLTAVYWWRATSTSVPPTLCGVFNDDTGVLVASAETFADPGLATGWIKQTLATPVSLSSGQAYKVAVYGVALGYSATANYWDTGAGAAGITTGIITAPNNADSGGQDTFNTSATPMQHPTSSFNAGNYWIDLEVTTSGATNYTQTITDGTGSTDTTAQLLTAVQQFTDPTGSTDTASQVSAAQRSFTDSTGSTDSVAQQATNFYAQTFTDSTGSTDTVAQLAAMARSQTDPTGSTDSLASGVTVPRTFTDDAGSTDLGQTYQADYAETLTDPTGSTDNMSQQSSSAGGQTFTDNAGSSDSIIQQSVTNYSYTFTDDAGLTDLVAKAVGKLLTDLAGNTDTTSQVANQTRIISDDAGSTDTVNQQSSGAGAQTFTDDAGSRDSVTQAAVFSRTISDDTGSADVVSQQSSSAGGQTFTDTTGSTDSVLRSVTYIITITDSTGSTDQMIQPGQRDVDIVHVAVEPGRLSVSVESGPTATIGSP